MLRMHTTLPTPISSALLAELQAATASFRDWSAMLHDASAQHRQIVAALEEATRPHRQVVEALRSAGAALAAQMRQALGEATP